ncbi:hypothetical protein C1637_15180 [Chryseobacterium lactis]|uniref:Lipoprotein n=1 Tax=Chryseobacterium lactis TaxID=1241981 RepID=A0A3G6RI89_CHRLC|nr:hypothetical protein EG342_17385 [Chryseobacterium lactis]AZB03928.1 hypothetical protein EG341_08260 [Chryseobacterium lactis]PNW13277.1 hypothetical protein C1637_15180 [Chryseobacterium lactis]
MISTSFLTLLSCETDAQKLKIATIYAAPKRVVKEIPETGKTHIYTTRQEVTERLSPMILMLSKNAETLQFRIQGNIDSSGHNIHQVRKIRFEKGELNGNGITLRYYVEIKKKPGKESADVKGYNYTKDETYNIPNDVKIIKIELYEDRINDAPDSKPKLIAQQIFNSFVKI